MKKLSIYIMSFIAMATFVACDENFKDWADPQTNPQEDLVDITFQVAAASATAFDLNTITAETIEIAKQSSLVVEEGSTVTYTVSLDSDEQFSNKLATMDLSTSGDVYSIAASDLQNAVVELYGRRPDARELKLRVNAAIANTTGLAFVEQSNVLSITVTPVAPVIESAYYITGDVIDGWGPESVLQFTRSDKDVYDDPIFELLVNNPKENANFKIIPQSGVEEGADFWGSALGSAVDGDTSLEGAIVGKTDKDPGAIMIEETGWVKITLDMMSYTYTIEPLGDAPITMYVTGSPWGWATPGDNALTPIHSVDGFWKIVYLEADSEIKFFPEASWENGAGFPEAIISEESIALGGLSDNGGNIKVANAGWYLVAVTVAIDGQYTIQFAEPQVWLIGDASNGGWSAIASNPADLFTVPADGDGEFVSPAFVANGNLRMAVVLPGIDWWKTEFNIYSEMIEYRGKGDDQAGVAVTAGQKAYLNFSNNTGKIQ